MELLDYKRKAPTNIIVKNLEDAAALDFFLDYNQVDFYLSLHFFVLHFISNLFLVHVFVKILVYMIQKFYYFNFRFVGLRSTAKLFVVPKLTLAPVGK